MGGKVCALVAMMVDVPHAGSTCFQKFRLYCSVSNFLELLQEQVVVLLHVMTVSSLYQDSIAVESGDEPSQLVFHLLNNLFEVI